MTPATLVAVSDAVVLLAVAWFVIAHSVSLLSVVAVYARLRASRRRGASTSHDAAVSSPASPGVSIVIVAGDDRAALVERIRALLLVDYPRFEVVVAGAG